MLRALSLVALAAAVLPARAEETSKALAGTVDGSTYVSPTGAFRMEIPVLPALGGEVHDTSTVVTFRDGFGLQVSVGAFVHDATQRWELSTRGIKDYLIHFFGTYVLADFRRFCPETTLESAGFSADFEEGSLFTYILMPGGSMFSPPQQFSTTAPAPPVAKRGNLVFVKYGYTYVISTELSERVTEGSRYSKTTDEENLILRSRLADIVKKMEFTRPAPAKTVETAQPTPKSP